MTNTLFFPKQLAIFENKIKAQNVLKPKPQSITWPKTITETWMMISTNKGKKPHFSF